MKVPLFIASGAMEALHSSAGWESKGLTYGYLVSSGISRSDMVIRGGGITLIRWLLPRK